MSEGGLCRTTKQGKHANHLSGPGSTRQCDAMDARLEGKHSARRMFHVQTAMLMFGCHRLPTSKISGKSRSG